MTDAPKDTLPPLPPFWALHCGVRNTPTKTKETWGILYGEDYKDKQRLYTEQQMIDYAKAALAAADQNAGAQAPTTSTKPNSPGVTPALPAPTAAPTPEMLLDEIKRRLVEAESERDALKAQIARAEEGLPAKDPFVYTKWGSEAESYVNSVYNAGAAGFASRDATIEALHTRLEDNFCFDLKGNRIEVEAGSIPDGISCRDETIKLQKATIEALRTYIGKLKPYLRHGTTAAVCAAMKHSDNFCDCGLDEIISAMKEPTK